MFIKWLLCYAKYCFSWLVYVGNTISNWLFLIPPFFGAILSWQYKLERRYTFAFISLCGKLCTVMPAFSMLSWECASTHSYSYRHLARGVELICHSIVDCGLSSPLVQHVPRQDTVLYSHNTSLLLLRRLGGTGGSEPPSSCNLLFRFLYLYLPTPALVLAPPCELGDSKHIL